VAGAPGRRAPGTRGVFFLDLDGLNNFAMLSWVAVLRASHDFRSRSGILRISAGGGTRRLIERYLRMEWDRTNLEIM
jgi:hypothetical protein